MFAGNAARGAGQSGGNGDKAAGGNIRAAGNADLSSAYVYAHADHPHGDEHHGVIA